MTVNKKETELTITIPYELVRRIYKLSIEPPRIRYNLIKLTMAEDCILTYEVKFSEIKDLLKGYMYDNDSK